MLFEGSALSEITTADSLVVIGILCLVRQP
jgi:hypothetical protein